MIDTDRLLAKLNKFDTDNEFIVAEPAATIALDVYEVRKILRGKDGFSRWQTIQAAIDLMNASGDL